MEILYSEAIFIFLRRVKQLTLTILSSEMGIKVGSTRFYYKSRSYPLHFVAFEHPSKLGYFEASFYEIGVNKAYIFEDDEKLLDLLRHEMAHYFTFIIYGPHVPHHGKEFHVICKKYHWKSEVSRAVIRVEKALKNEKVLSKVRKLLSLATSDNESEAQAATLKAQELLHKYNLELKESGDEMHLVRVLPQKKRSAKLVAIAAILRTFLVHPIFNRGNGSIYLELLGTKVNVEVAEYVAYFLDKKFETLWKHAKAKNPSLSGVASKNSFFRGLSKGYLLRPKESSAALVKMENQLVETAHSVYPRLSNSKSYYIHDKEAEKLGKQRGRELTIEQGIKSKNLQKILS